MSTIDSDSRSVEPLLIAACDLAAMLNISPRTLWRLKSGGLLPEPVRFGGAVRWRLDEIRNWVASGCPPPDRRDN